MMTLDTITSDFILSQLPELPNEGVVAGGAIASIVYSAVTGLKSEYGDIDVFRLADTCFGSRDVDVKSLYYQDKNFKIFNTSTVDNINYVDIYSINSKLTNVIDTFDINCCMIGIDLATKQLMYRPEFAAFLNTRQIEVFNFNNSKSTLFRLLKKKRQYPDAYLDVDKIVGYIAHINGYLTSSSLKIPTYITNDDLNLISNYFKLDSRNKFASSYSIPELVKLPGFNKNNNIVFQRLYGNGVKKHQREQWLELLKYYMLSNACITNDTYFLTLPKGWKTQLARLGKFTNEHYSIIFWFKYFNLDKQLELFKFIENLINVEGKWVIGALESIEGEVKWKSNYDLNLLKERITKLINDNKVKLNKVLVTPLPINRHYLECEVIELVTPLQLLDEGKYNNHCVGGYSNSLNENRRIFSIRIDKYRFTCEFKYHDYRNTIGTGNIVNPWYLIQCKSFNNTTPDKYPELKTRIEAVILWLLLQLEENNSSKSLAF
jgi:hypothetical protein